MGFQTVIRAENFLSVEKELEVLWNSFHKVTKFAEYIDYNSICNNVMPTVMEVKVARQNIS